MTVAATTNRKTYTGDNVTTSFATSPVIFYLTSDLQVRTTIIATGVSTLLTENTHYTVSGGGAAGLVGTVNLAGGSSPHGALLSTEKLVILRVLPLTQASNFVNNNNSDAVVLMTALDKLTDVDQQIQEQADRSIRFASGDVSGSVTEIPDVTTRSGRLLGFDATGLLTTLVVQIGTSLVSLAAAAGASLIGFIQAGTGAILRTVQAKERDIVALADFDTSGHFDTAVAALGTTGKYSVGGTFKAAPGDATHPGLGFNTNLGTGIATGLHSTSLSVLVDGLGEALWINGGGQLIGVNGTAAVPTYSFVLDGGTGTYLETSDVLGIAAGIIRVAKFRVQILSDNTASGDLLTLFSGGGSCYTKTKHYTTTAIAAVAKTIHVMDEFACWILVSGNDGTNFFMDELMGMFGSAPVVKNSFTQGAPAARTYTLNASANIQLVMAAGTYVVNTFSLQLKAR